jgi:hypothetical protein
VILKRLRARRTEIEAALFARVCSVADPGVSDDPDYTQGLRSAVASALDYALAVIDQGDRRAVPVPLELLAQARLAARSGVNLDTVLRRYFAGFALLGNFLVQEAQDDGLQHREELQGLLGLLSTLLDHLVIAVSDEYARASGGGGSTEERRAADTRRLLAGDALDAPDLSYDFDAHHVGLIAAGADAAEALRALASTLDRRLLLIDPGDGSHWAWLSSRRHPDPARLRHLVSKSWPTQATLAVGEAAPSVTGWRLTHRQARAALPIALRGGESPVHYGEVALLASILQDDLLVTSLRRLYLLPLADKRGGGETLRQTLRAYFAAESNVSSAAMVLRVKRHTVTNRLRTVEKLIGQPLHTCAAEMDAALKLEGLGDPRVLHPALPQIGAVGSIRPSEQGVLGHIGPYGQGQRQ